MQNLQLVFPLGADHLNLCKLETQCVDILKNKQPYTNKHNKSASIIQG